MSYPRAPARYGEQTGEKYLGPGSHAWTLFMKDTHGMRNLTGWTVADILADSKRRRMGGRKTVRAVVTEVAKGQP